MNEKRVEKCERIPKVIENGCEKKKTMKTLRMRNSEKWARPRIWVVT